MKNLTLCLTLIVLSGCGLGHECTLVGCGESVTLELSGRATRVEATLSPFGHPEFELTASCEDCQQLRADTFFCGGDCLEAFQTAEVLVVEVTARGAGFSGDLGVERSVSHPNGPECGPECPEMMVRVPLE